MKISVIVPVYNAEKFLSRSIESVLNQTYQDIDLLLINDGSTDSSEEICISYAQTDNRSRIISQKNNGPAAARNAGIREARGEFVFFLDADDFIEKDTLEILVNQYIQSNDQNKPDMVMSNFCKLENNGEIVNQGVSFHPDGKPVTFENNPIPALTLPLKGMELPSSFVSGRRTDESFEYKKLSKPDIVAYVRHFLKHPSNHLISYCWARLYKLSVIKDNAVFAHEDMRLFEDFIFNLEYLRHTNEIVFVNKPLYTYTMHNNHVSASMAIVNANSLLHDMEIFRRKTVEFLHKTSDGTLNIDAIQKEVSHALIHYVIIFLIRSCRQMNTHNRRMIYNEINKIVNAPITRDSLQHYTPSNGNSRIIPLLMKLKKINLLMDISKCKAFRRYGKPSE